VSTPQPLLEVKNLTVDTYTDAESALEQFSEARYDAIISGEDLSQNILLRPEDTIYVP